MLANKERRRFKRYPRKSGSRLAVGKNSFQADITDYSIGGFGLSVDDEPSILPGSAIDLRIEDLDLDADGWVVWSQKVNSHIKVGIRRRSISGRLKYYPLSDVFLDLQRNEKDGILEMENGSVSKKIYIKNGDMVFATSNTEGDHLGELLLKAGKISLDQYYRSVDVMEKTKQRHGAVLVGLGYLKPENLIWAVKHQVEEIILSLFRWEDGKFLFTEVPVFPEEVITLKLSAANLIYRGIKRITNFTYIRNTMPPVDTVLYYSTDPINLFQNISLDKTDKDILSLIDGKRNIQKILSISPSDNFQTMKTLCALLSTRIIEAKEKESGADEPYEEIMKEPETDVNSAFLEKVEELYGKLQSVDFYGIFGIEKQATPAEIKKAYYRVAKEFHPDRHFFLPSETLKNKLNAIFSCITEAHKVLSDPTMRREYDYKLSARHPKIERSNVEMAREKFREGKTAFKEKSYAEAEKLFGQAVYLDSSVPDYHFHMGMVFGKKNKWSEAGKSISKALKLDPFNAAYMAELGHIYLELGFNVRAKTTFEKAMKFEPSNKRALEGLQKIRKSTEA